MGDLMFSAYSRGVITGGRFLSLLPYNVVLPTGSVIGAGTFECGFFSQSIQTNAIAKYNVAKRLKLDTVAIYGLPVDQNDGVHYGGRFFPDIAYNPTSNLIYTSEATHHRDGGPCTYSSNYLKVTAVDTMLRFKWEKYIQSGANHCITQLSTTSAIGRSGVLVSGINRSNAAPTDTSLSKGFIFYVDSASTTAVNDLGIVVRDRFRIYPNPVSDKLIVDDILNSSISAILYDVTGKMIQVTQITENPSFIPCSNLQPGAYMLKIQLKDGSSYSQRIFRR